MISNILSFSGDDKPNDLNQNERALRFDKKIFEKFLSKTKQVLSKSQISRHDFKFSNILSFSGDDKPNDLNQTETSNRSEPKPEKLSESTNLRSTSKY